MACHQFGLLVVAPESLCPLLGGSDERLNLEDITEIESIPATLPSTPLFITHCLSPSLSIPPFLPTILLPVPRFSHSHPSRLPRVTSPPSLPPAPPLLKESSNAPSRPFPLRPFPASMESIESGKSVDWPPLTSRHPLLVSGQESLDVAHAMNRDSLQKNSEGVERCRSSRAV